MDVPTREDLMALTNPEQPTNVSIYLPTQRLGPETRENPIRLKNLLREAEDDLVEVGFRRTRAKDLLGPAWALHDDFDFWQNQSGGLALFLDERSERHYRVPFPFAELAVVAPHFHLKPLLPYLAGEEVFYVLALSMNETRLLECTPFAEEEVRVADMPQNMSSALWADDSTKPYRSVLSGAGNVARIHGGASEVDAKDDLLRYFRKVEGALSAHLGNIGNPLILACVEYLAPIYREANTYGHLLETVLSGNPDDLTPAQLREEAWELVRPSVQAKWEQDTQKYHGLIGTGRTTGDVSEAALAAMSGRVELAFVAVGVQHWGQIDIPAHAAYLHSEAEPGDRDMLDFVAIQTLLNGGIVHALPPDQVPEASGVAAVFRY